MSKTYEHTGQMTEWDDILIKKGITTRDAVLESRGLNPEDVSGQCSPHRVSIIVANSLHLYTNV